MLRLEVCISLNYNDAYKLLGMIFYFNPNLLDHEKMQEHIGRARMDFARPGGVELRAAGVYPEHMLTDKLAGENILL